MFWTDTPGLEILCAIVEGDPVTGEAISSEQNSRFGVERSSVIDFTSHIIRPMIFSLFLGLALSVFQLDDRGFEQHVTKGSKSIPWFIMFGGQNCPGCLMAAPEFEAASQRSRGFARFAYADTAAAPAATSSLGIRAIPAFFLFTDSGRHDFSGSYTAGSFLQFIADVIGEGLEEADESWIGRNDNHVILFTRKFKAPPIFSAACVAFKSKGIAFGMARDSDTFEGFGSPPVPSIWFFKDGEKVMYKGKQDFIPLMDKISEHFAVEPDDGEAL
jgi:thiol-disulfide isomerase/thioredoxin